MKDVSVKRQMKRTGIVKDAVLDLAAGTCQLSRHTPHTLRLGGNYVGQIFPAFPTVSHSGQFAHFSHTFVNDSGRHLDDFNVLGITMVGKASGLSYS